MMAKWRAFLSCILLLLHGCYGVWTPTPGRVLMLGDSYMSANSGLGTILTSLLKGAGDKHQVEVITSGGKDLAWHAKQVEIAGSVHAKALGSEAHPWELVVLQDQSHVPAFCCNGPKTDFYADFTSSLAAVHKLDHSAEAHGAKTVFLQTWGRRSGAPVSFLKNFEDMNELIIRGYDAYAEQVTTSTRKPLVAPVGAAFSLIYNEVTAAGSPKEALSTDNLWRDLYSEDGSHPSVAGSYLAACVLYVTITNKSPIGLVTIAGVSAPQASVLQHKAHEAAFANATVVSALREVEGHYKTNDPDVQGFVAEIRNGVVIWPVGVHTRLTTHGKQLEMFFHGKVYKGSFSGNSITWSDGDIWKRSTEVQGAVLMDSSQKRQRSLARREPDHPFTLGN